MKNELATLEAEVLDAIQPFTGLPVKSEQVIYGGNTMQQVRTAYTTAVSVQQPRSIAKIANNVFEEARLAGKSFYYRWKVNSKDGPKVVEGPSIDMTMALCRHYGNMANEVEVTETSTHFLFKATFIDLESGFSSPRLFRQRKNQNTGMKDADRQEDIIFQIGQSKAIRNAVRNAMPAWLIERAIEIATDAELNKTNKENIHLARQKVIEFFGGYGVTADRIEAERDRPVDQWTPQDIVDLRGMATALKEGRIGPDELFPKTKSVVAAEAPPEDNHISEQQQVTPVTLDELVADATAPPDGPPISPTNPQSGDTTWAGFRARFVNLKGAGYSTFVFQNLEQFKTCTKEIHNEAIGKWVKLYPGKPWPLNAVTESKLSNVEVTTLPRVKTDFSPPNGYPVPNGQPPVSFSPEYKALMDLKNQFPDQYLQAKADLKINPDTVMNCLNLMAMVSFKVDEMIPPDVHEPDLYEPPDVTDTSGFGNA